MTSSIRRRIEKLEAADKRLTRRIIWEDGTGSAEREIARLEAVGELDGVELHIVHWQTDAAIAAANELTLRSPLRLATRMPQALSTDHFATRVSRTPAAS